MELCFLGVEPLIATKCPCFNTTNAYTLHERKYPQAGAKVTKHQPLTQMIPKGTEMALRHSKSHPLRTETFEWTLLPLQDSFVTLRS